MSSESLHNDISFENMVAAMLYDRSENPQCYCDRRLYPGDILPGWIDHHIEARYLRSPPWPRHPSDVVQDTELHNGMKLFGNDSQMRQCSYCFMPLQKRLKIGADNLCHPANCRIPHEIVHLDALSFVVEANHLHHRIQANFIAELEAVGKRLLRAADTRDHTVECMGLHTLRIGLTGKPAGLRSADDPGGVPPLRAAAPRGPRGVSSAPASR